MEEIKAQPTESQITPVSQSTTDQPIVDQPQASPSQSTQPVTVDHAQPTPSSEPVHTTVPSTSGKDEKKNSSPNVLLLAGVGVALILLGVLFAAFTSTKQTVKKDTMVERQVTPTESALSPEEQDAAAIDVGDNSSDFSQIDKDIKSLE